MDHHTENDRPDRGFICKCLRRIVKKHEADKICQATHRRDTQQTEVIYIILNKATATAETSIISLYWRLFSDEFLHFNREFQPMSLFKEKKEKNNLNSQLTSALRPSSSLYTTTRKCSCSNNCFSRSRSTSVPRRSGWPTERKTFMMHAMPRHSLSIG